MPPRAPAGRRACPLFDNMANMIPLTIRVNLAERGYDIRITSGDPSGVGPFARERARGSRAFLVTDRNVVAHARAAGEALAAAGFEVALAELPPGEAQKSLAVASAAATRLLKDVYIQRRLAELRQKTEVETMLTLDEHMRELKLLREMAKGKDDIKAAIAAEVKRGELRQFYVKRVETGGPGAFS